MHPNESENVQDSLRRAQESGVEGYRAESDDELGDLDIYEALIDPNGAAGKSGSGAGGGAPMMMPPMGMGGRGMGGAQGGQPVSYTHLTLPTTPYV